MTTIKIDNINCDIEKLSTEAKAQSVNLQFCEQDLARLKAQTATLQTAEAAYSKALQAALPAIGGSDAIKL